MHSKNIYLFLGVQTFLWSALTVLIRLSWFGYEPPRWSDLLLYTGLGLFYSSLLGAVFTRLFDNKAVHQLLLSLLFTAIAAMLWRVTDNAIGLHFVEEEASRPFTLLDYVHNGRTTTAQMMVWAAGYWAVFYYIGFTNQQARAKAAAAQAQAAKLRLLHYQVNPHFLFNALGGVDTLLLKNSVGDARKMLGMLTDYLRQTLEREPAATTPLELEIERVEGYLDIEKIRAGDRLSVRWHLPDILPEGDVPTGILLPLVENAVKHGAINSRAGGYLDIRVSVDSRHLIIQLENDVRQTSEPGFGIGLTNTRDRLETLYGDAASLLVESQSGTFRIIVKVPRNHDD